MSPYESEKRVWARDWLKKAVVGYAGYRPFDAGGELIEVINPSDGSVLCRYKESSHKDVDNAVFAAKKAFERGESDWSVMQRSARIKCLRSLGELIRTHQAELATLESLSNGKTYRESYLDDLPESADVFDYYAGWIDKLYGESSPVEREFVNYTKREPVGVCGLIVPWNFPLLLACWKIAPALAMGNTVVVKPAPQTSLTLVRLAQLITEAKILPDGVFNVVLGGGAVGEALTKHKQVDKVSFTGGTDTGRRVLEGSAASNLKLVTLELGGKSPCILFEDVEDLHSLLDQFFVSMFCHKGEKCSEPTRLIVHQDIHDTVVTHLSSLAEKVRCGDPFDPKVTQGPQAFSAHAEKIMSYIKSGVDEGATLVAGGCRDESVANKNGCFIRPTIFTDVKPFMKIFREEIFGPVLSISIFKTELEAIALANDTDYGLAAGVYTKDVDRAFRVANALDAGQVFVNKYGCYDFAAPFGGFKQSGWGKEMAIHSLDSYTRVKSIWFKIAKQKK